MERQVIEAEPRSDFGKGPNRRLRRKGLIPAVVYGEREPSVPIAVSPKDITRILRSASGVNTIFTLKIRGAERAENVMVKDYQLEPLEHRLLHADLIRVSMDHAMTVTVPVELRGTAPGVKQQGGMLDFVTRSVEVTCLPGDIPDAVEVDVSELMIGGIVRAKDLRLPPNVRLETDPDVVLVHILAPRVEEAAEEEAAAEAEAAEPEVIKKGKGEEEDEEKDSE